MLNVLLFFLYLSASVLLIFKSRFFSFPGIKKRSIVLVFMLKIAVSVLFYYIYTDYYPNRAESDMYRYFDDAFILDEARNEPADYLRMLSGIGANEPHLKNAYYLRMNNWYESFDSLLHNDNRTMIRLNAFFLLFSGGSIFIHKLFFIILSFTGLFWIVKSLQSIRLFENRMLFWLSMLFPSLLFWTSSITKEALLVFTLGGFLYFLSRIRTAKFSFLYLLLTIVFICGLFFIKTYVVLVLLAPLLANILSGRLRPVFALLLNVFIIALYIVGIWHIHKVFPDVNFVEAFIRKQGDFINYARYIQAGSFIDVQYLTPQFGSFLKAIPGAMVTVLFRPFIWESSNILMFASALENLAFIGMLIVLPLSFNKKFVPDSAYWFALFFSLFFLALIGIATPVLGAVVRYKIVAYPFLFFCLIKLADEQKLKNLANLLHRNRKKTTNE